MASTVIVVMMAMVCIISARDNVLGRHYNKLYYFYGHQADIDIERPLHEIISQHHTTDNTIYKPEKRLARNAKLKDYEKDDLDEKTERNHPDYKHKFPPKFKHPSRMFKMDIKSAGSSTRLRCAAEGFPTPNITWYKNKTTPILRSYFQPSYGKWSMALDELTKADNGNYTCVVCNELGCIEHTVVLQVQERLYAKPVLIKGVVNQTMLVGQTVTFSCEFYSDMHQYIYWMYFTNEDFVHNETVIGDSQESIVIFDNNKLIISNNPQDKPDHLTLYNITKENEGWYVCVALNTLGNTTAKGYLTVLEYGPSSPTPSVVAGSEEIGRLTTTLVDTKVLQQRQEQILTLFNRIHEPLTDKNSLKILSEWHFGDHFEDFNNVTAAKTYYTMIERKWFLPRSVPYSPYEPAHNAESFTLFNVLYSAKTFETFYNTAVYLREVINQGLFYFVMSTTIFYRHDTQGLTIPPIYENMPSYFNYGEIINTADKVKAFGHNFASTYPAISMFGSNDAVINANEIFWPYRGESISAIKYFTNDYGLNAGYYYTTAMYPYWLGKHQISGVGKDRRGELWWFNHKQIIARYYLERLSAGLGEIPILSQTNVVSEGFNPGLVYENGIPYPSRPDDFHLNRPEFSDTLETIKKFEERLWDAIDQGFYYDKDGKQVSLLNEQAIDVLGNLVESNADSPNSYFYKDFIRLWKQVLGGNTFQQKVEYYKRFTPLVVPSALENYQTALRDPAFYMLWKRVLALYFTWQKRMPLYKPEELKAKGVEIENVEVDKLTTFFDKSTITYYPNIFKPDEDNVSIRYPRLNHKPFTFTVTVKSEEKKKVWVKFFLAPKYDSQGMEIPLFKNTDNFFQLDQFWFDLEAGENKIIRKSTAAPYTADDWWTTTELYEKVVQGQWKPTSMQFVPKFPNRLLLPKGHHDGFPFLLITYIQDYVPPKTEFSSGYDRSINHGLGSGARFPDDYPLGYPANRPLHVFQVADLKNFKMQDVKIFHVDN